jgi:hypothetical protein
MTGKQLGVTAALTFTIAFAIAYPALGETKGRAAKEQPATKAEVEQLRTHLKSDKEAEILEALDAITKRKDASLGPLLSELLARGGTVKVLVSALEAVGKLKSPALSSAVAPYVRHREDDVRRAAARTLVKTGGPVAVAALRQALRSQDAFVRGIAASGLGTLGAKEALDDLFAALGQRVAEAASSIGQLCEPAACEKYLGFLGKYQFDVMTSGLDQMLFRPAASVPDEVKLKVIGRLRELGTAEAGRYLSDVLGRWPKDGSNRVRQALESAAKSARGRSE